MKHQSLFQEVEETYTPRKVACFSPKRIILAKGWNANDTQQQLVQKICRLYPEVDIEDCSEMSHNRVTVQGENALGQHQAGKQTLVFSEHKSSIRFSDEEGNTCPNYWHFSLYGFCCKFRLENGENSGVKPEGYCLKNGSLYHEVGGLIKRGAGFSLERSLFFEKSFA